jgi:hypothetical protein
MVPLVAPEWRNAADIVGLAAIGLGMVLLLALVFILEKKK